MLSKPTNQHEVEQILKIHGIAFKPEYTDEPMVTLIGQLHANQVNIQEDYLSPLGLECLNFVNKMALSAAEAQSDTDLKISQPYQDATQLLWEAVSAANQAPSITHTERFMDKKLLDSADHTLGIIEKSAEALDLTKTPFIQGLKVVRDILILTKRLNDPQIDPMLVGIDATAHFLGEKVSKKTTKISKIVDGVVQEKDNHDPLERIICSAMGGVAQLSVDLAFSGVFALYKIPQFAGCMYKVALVRAGLGTAYGAASQNTTDFFSNTLGDHVKDWSHLAFQKERERRLDENSTIADPDTLHLGFPVHPKQAQVLADKVSSGLTHVVEIIVSTPTDAADLMDGMHTGMPVDNQQSQVLAKVASKVYQHVKQTVLSTPPDAANLMQGMDVGAPIDQNQAQVVGERLANAYHKVKEWVLDATDKVGDLLSVNTRTPEQDSQLQQHLIAQIATENRIYQNLNPFIPKTTLPPLLNHHYNTPYYQSIPSFHTPFSWDSKSTLFESKPLNLYRLGSRPDYVERSVRSAVSMELALSIGRRPSGSRAYNNACADIRFTEFCLGIGLGSGYSLGWGEFCDIVRISGLLLSYNGFNAEYGLEELEADFFGLGIGGVASEVALIADLINSEAQAELNQHGLHICLPKTKLPLDLALVEQVYREVSFAYRSQKTVPFFSLHFNNDADLYLIVHPAFKGTHVEKVIVLLDYWMKGFLNGGVFNEEFLLNTWHATGCSQDDAFLRQHLLDLKQYCRENPEAQALKLSYFSLRELMSREELERPQGSFAHKMPFQTSFRIISTTKMQRKKNLLVPDPDFRVEYSIDESAEYKEYLERFKADHGTYPADYLQIRRAYATFAQEIKQTFPKMPFCADYFKLLGLATAFCYVDMTLDNMGKEPILTPIKNEHKAPFPNKLPPIPVRYFKKLPLKLQSTQVMHKIFEQDLDSHFLALFNVACIETLPLAVENKIKHAVMVLIEQKAQAQLNSTLPFEPNDYEIDRICKQVSEYMLAYVILTQSVATQREEELRALLPTSLQQTGASNLSLVGRLKQTQGALQSQYSTAKKRLSAQTQALFSEQDVLNMIPSSKHTEVSDVLPKIKRRQEQTVIQQAQLAEHLNKLTSELAKLNDAMVTTSTLIQSYETQKRDALAKLSALDRQLNQANIDKFCREVDEQIAKLRESEQTFTQGINELKQEQTRVNELIKPKESYRLSSMLREFTLNLLGELNSQYEVKLDGYVRECEHFGAHLLTVCNNHVVTLCEHYMHTRIGFTNKDLIKETGDLFEIVGGCGVSLPNLQCTALANADAFYAKAMGSRDEHGATLREFEFDGVSYGVFDLKVQNKPHTPKLVSHAMDASGSALHVAASILSVESMAQLINDQPQHMQHPDDFGHYPIHFAAKEGNLEVVKYLCDLDAGCLDVQNKKGLTPLIMAVQSGQLAVVAYLLSRGAHAHHALHNGLFPLFISIQNNFIDIAHALLPYLTPQQCSQSMDSGMTPLHSALRYGMETLALDLIVKGVDLSVAVKSSGMTPFHYAVISGLTACVQSMIQRDASVIKQTLPSGKTALHLAAQAGHVAVVSCLLEAGIDSHALTQFGESALMLSIVNKHNQVAVLLAPTAALNQTNRRGQNTALQAVLFAMPTIADKMWQRGELRSAVDADGFNALYYLARGGDVARVMQWVREQPAALSTLFQQRSLLAVAACFGHFDLVAELFTCKVGVAAFKSPHKNETLLQLAVKWDQIGFVREWITQNPNLWADNSLKSQLGQLAAESAASRCLPYFVSQVNYSASRMHQFLLASLERGCVSSVHFLLAHPKVNVNQALNPVEDRALHIAVRTGSRVILELLLECGADVTLRNQMGDTAFHRAIALDDAFLLKRLFKLTPPKAWPADLVALKKQKHSALIARVLDKHMVRMPKGALVGKAAVVSQPGHPVLKPAEKADFSMVQSWLRLGQLQLLKTSWRPSIQAVFESAQGGQLWQLMLMSIQLPAADAKGPDAIDALFDFLRQNKLDPGRHGGPYNPLHAIIEADNDDTACYRLTMLEKYFPQTWTKLLSDPSMTKKTSFPLLASFKHFPKLFQQFALSIQHENAMQNSIFHQAVAYERGNEVQMLLKSCAVDERNAEGQTALMVAAGLGNINLLSMLLEAGADLQLLDREGRNALHYAIEHRKESTALYLLAIYAYPNAHDRRGSTPLILAASLGILAVVDYLCQHADYSEERNHKGMNALHVAASMGQTEVVEQLVRHGFAVDAPVGVRSRRLFQCTALHLAALSGHTKTMSTLLSLGASPTRKDTRGSGLIEYGIRSKRPAMVQLMQELPHYGHPSQHASMLFAAVETDHHVVLCELILARADLSVVNANGCSLLHHAVLHDAALSCKILIQTEQVSLDLCDQDGDTALHYAAKLGSVACIELCVEGGASIDQRNAQGLTPLYLSAELGHRGAVVSLLNYAANVTLAHPHGMTPAQIALKNGHVAIAARLVHYYQDKSCEDAVINSLAQPLQSELRAMSAKLKLEVTQLARTPVLSQHGFLRTFYPPARVAKQRPEAKVMPVQTSLAIQFQQRPLQHVSRDFCMKGDDFTKQEKVSLLSVMQGCAQCPVAPGDAVYFQALVLQVKETFGSYISQQLMSVLPGVKPHPYATYLSLLQLLLELKDEQSIFAVLRENKHDFNQLKRVLQEKHLTYVDKKHPLRAPEVVLAAFKQTEFALPENELNDVAAVYVQIKQQLQTLRGLSLDELVDRTHAYVQTLSPRGPVTLKPPLFALLIESFRKEPSLAAGLYDTQIFIILILLNYPETLKGRILQVNTGEGKSKINTMVATYLALHGYTVDVITTSEDLAARDGREALEFFKRHRVTDSIQYMKNTDPEFVMLDDGIDCTNKRQDRPLDYVLVDEVDSLIIDMARNSARRAIQNRDECAFIYEPILNFARARGSVVSMTALRDYLCAFRQGRYRADVAKLNDRQLDDWLKSAASALNVYREGRDYIVRRAAQHVNRDAKDEIVIVNYADTGDTSEGCEWGKGLHQFLQVKHQISPTPESLTVAATSHGLYFNRYQKGMLGLSGSVGDHTERAEIAQIHAIDSYDMPPHFPSIRQSLDTQLASTRAHHYAMIVTFIQSMQKAGRPCLILVKTISDEQEINSVSLSAHLTQRGLTHQVLNGEQNESADYMISKMGHPKMITIATNLAGRGTNPKLHPDSMKAGGLGMRFTFYPHNTRVKTQGFGRAGRQGQPGCSGMILGMDDPYFKEHDRFIDFKPSKDSQGLYKSEDIKRFMQQMDAIQAAQIAKQSQQRIDFFTRQQPFDQKLQWFFQKNAAVHQLFATPEFAQQAIELIDSCVFHPTITSTKRREPWLHELRDKALMLHQQSSGEIGQVFYPLFKQAYLAEIQYIWALFYDSLEPDMPAEDERRAYKKVKTQLDSYLNNPAERALSLIVELADGLSQTLEPVV